MLVLATTILCDDTQSTKAPDHQQKDHPKQTGSFGIPQDQHHNMGEMPKGPDNKQQQQQQQPPNLNHN